MIKSAAQILAEITDTDPDMIEARQRAVELAKPLKRPRHPGQRRRNRYPDARKPRVLPVRLCSIPGCTEKHLANDYCAAHNYRFRTYGDPLAGRQPRKSLGKIEELG